MGAKRVTLYVFVPCLLGYIFLTSWFALREMLVLKEAFLFLGPRTGCFKAFPHGYNTYSVCLVSIFVPAAVMTLSTANFGQIHLLL